MDLTPLLPIRAVTVELAFSTAARLRFFHQPAVGALVRRLMDGALTDERWCSNFVISGLFGCFENPMTGGFQVPYTRQQQN